MTFYLKYRPQNLEELDLESVRVSLKKIVESKNIPHAFLFEGPRGTGKTSTARILAKIVNCENSKKAPCNECEECISIMKGTNLDVVELDAASHRGIDDIRILRDAVKLAPSRAKKKVYIIDEAHMLTTEASNALLKTLEEPPSHVVFILATTNPEKLINTIQSRTTVIKFTKATVGETVRSLERVAKGEKIKVSEEVLKTIASASDGAFRDAVKVFENLISEGVELTSDKVAEFIFKRKGFDLDKFIDLLQKKEVKGLVQMIGDSISKGAVVQNILEDVLAQLRLGLLQKVGIGEKSLDNFSKEDLIALIELFSEAFRNVSSSPIEELPLELAIIKWSDKSTGNSEENKIEKEKVDTPPDYSKKVSATSASEVKPSLEKTSEKEVKLEQPPQDAIDIGNLKEINEEVWKNILAKMRPINASIEALLRASRPIGYDGKNLKVGVFYKFHKERLEDVNHRRIVEDVVTNIFGNPTRVVCTLTEPPVKVIKEEVKVETVLTEGQDQDIIKVAQDIFSN